LVVSRQRPPTAGGFAFFVLEDGPNRAQLIISPQLWEAKRTLLRDARILVADVVVEATGYQSSLRAESLMALSINPTKSRPAPSLPQTTPTQP
jgi:error-prone DNA polymerase